MAAPAIAPQEPPGFPLKPAQVPAQQPTQPPQKQQPAVLLPVPPREMPGAMPPQQQQQKVMPVVQQQQDLASWLPLQPLQSLKQSPLQQQQQKVMPAVQQQQELASWLPPQPMQSLQQSPLQQQLQPPPQAHPPLQLQPPLQVQPPLQMQPPLQLQPPLQVQQDQGWPGTLSVAQQMPVYGARTAQWTEVRVPEPNRGVVINAEFTGHQPRGPDGRPEVIHFYDEAIRSKDWNRLAWRLPRVRPMEESLTTWLNIHADYHNAVDMKGEYKLETANLQHGRGHEYHEHLQLRRPTHLQDTLEKVSHRLGREILNESQMRDFFSNPEAVAAEGLQ